MGYQSRKRHYKSPRERNAALRKQSRTVLIFVVLATLVWIYKNREEYWLHVKAWVS